MLARVLGATLLLAACSPSGPPAGPRHSADPGACGASTGEAVRRLTRFEYVRTIDALLDVDIDPATLPPDDEDGLENDASELVSSPLLVEAYLASSRTAASEVLARIERDGAEAFLGCAPEDADCIDGWIDGFGLRAWRRPLDDDERARVRALYDEIAANQGPSVAAAATVQAMLLSPRFVFRVEDPTGEPSGTPVDDWAIASRLSYFLWSSMPDDELLEAAAAGALRDSAERAAQASRMLEDPRAREAVVELHVQWLHLDEVEGAAPEPTSHPAFTETLRAEMLEESSRFVEATIFDREGTFEALLLSRWVEAGPELAAIYGIDPAAEELGPERAGILTRAAFLTGTSDALQPSPVERGVAILDALLCQELSPPAGLDFQEPDDQPTQTNREAWEQLTASPECASCHATINGIGFTFEHYDAIGAYRSHDGVEEVDATGTIEGHGVDGAVELSAVLAASATVNACAVEHWLRAARGRDLDETERCVAETLTEFFVETGGDVRSLILEIVASDLFVQ